MVVQRWRRRLNCEVEWMLIKNVRGEGVLIKENKRKASKTRFKVLFQLGKG